MQPLNLIVSEIEAVLKKYTKTIYKIYIKNNTIIIESEYRFMTLTVLEEIINIKNKYKMGGIIIDKQIKLFYFDKEITNLNNVDDKELNIYKTISELKEN